MRFFLSLFLFFPIISFASSEFIVGLDSAFKNKLQVTVRLRLEAKNPLCVDIHWTPTDGSVRGLSPISTPQEQFLKQTQIIDSDVYEYKYNYNSAFCQYQPEAILIDIDSVDSSLKLKKFYIIHDLKSEEEKDVIISLGQNKGNSYYVKFATTHSSPNVYISLHP